MSTFHDEYPYIGPVWYRSALSKEDTIVCVGIAECKQKNNITELMLLDGPYAGEKIIADFIYVPKKENDNSFRQNKDAIKLLADEYTSSLVGISLFEKRYLQEDNGLKQNDTINLLKDKYYKKAFYVLTSKESVASLPSNIDQILKSFIEPRNAKMPTTIEINSKVLNEDEDINKSKKEKINNPPVIPDVAYIMDNNYFSSRKEKIFVEENIKNISECKTPEDLKKTTIDLINHLNKKFVGQEHAAELIAQNILVNQYYINKGISDSELRILKSVLLVDGSTGTGKTAIVKEISEKLNVPVVVTTATAYSSVGYKGADLTDILEELLEKSHGNRKLAERGVVCIDEIDKLAQTREDTMVNKAAIQQELLTFIGGNKYTLDDEKNGNTITFDTSKLTFVGLGAFTNLRESDKKDISLIGFEREFEQKNISDSDHQIRDYVDYGMMKEFMGRITSIITTKDYSIEDYEKILLKSDISPLKGFIKSCSLLGIEKIDYTPEFVNELAREASEMESGARSLQRLMNEIKEKYTLPILKGEIDSLILTPKELKRFSSNSKKSAVY